MRTKPTPLRDPCAVCGGNIARHPGEHPSDYLRRHTCSPACTKSHAVMRRRAKAVKRRYANAPPGTVPLTRGAVAYVDPEDDARVRRYVWSLASRKGSLYAASKTGDKTSTYLHQFIMDPEPGTEVDHIDHDGLNCRRSNMREATKQQNQANRRKRAGCTSRYKGVYWNQRDRRWQVSIRTNGKRTHIGVFTDEEEAARAYDARASKLHGVFAYLNFPEEATTP